MAGSAYSWSTVFADNGTADGDVPWPEGMARRQVNDSARGIMGRVAEVLGDIGGALAAGGTANGLTVTANSAFTTLANGRIVAFRATADNTGAATLNVNSIGAKAIRKMDSTGDVALTAGEIQNTGIYIAQYSEALNGAAGAWLLVNPTVALSSFVTLTGTQTLTNKTLTGAVLNGTLGATTPSTVAGTTGTFSGAVSMAGLTATTGTFSGAVSGTTGTFSGNVTSANAFNSSGANVILSVTAGNILLRPDGVASGTGQMIVGPTGNVTINGTLTVTG